MNANTLGEFVAALRQEKGLTQKQLADRLGVTDKAVSRWEKGKNYPDIELLEPIAREFEVTVNELISGRRLGSGEILPESDSNIVHIIKINRRQKRIFSMVLALLLVFILIFGLYTIGRFSGLNSQPVRKTYDIYQNYLTAVLKEIEGRIYELSSGEGSWDTLYISEADVLFSPEKEINASAPMVSHLSVICSGNRVPVIGQTGLSFTRFLFILHAVNRIPLSAVKSFIWISVNTSAIRLKTPRI